MLQSIVIVSVYVASVISLAMFRPFLWYCFARSLLMIQVCSNFFFYTSRSILRGCVRMNCSGVDWFDSVLDKTTTNSLCNSGIWNASCVNAWYAFPLTGTNSSVSFTCLDHTLSQTSSACQYAWNSSASEIHVRYISVRRIRPNSSRDLISIASCAPYPMSGESQKITDVLYEQRFCTCCAYVVVIAFWRWFLNEWTTL